jgi:Phage integrase family
MSELREAVEEYLALRQSLGFTLRLPAQALRHFAVFLDAQGATYPTTELALCWAMLPHEAQPATWAWRLAVVRRFALWHKATDPRTEIPAPELLPHRYQRKSPHIYTEEEIHQIICTAGGLPSARGLRALTYATLFSLLAVTGMRVSEALALDRDDVDLDQGILTIRRTKFGKSRLLPLHPPPRWPSSATGMREIAGFPTGPARASSSPSGVPESPSGAPATPSPRWGRRSVCAPQPAGTATAPGYMTCATDLPLRRWWAGIEPATWCSSTWMVQAHS